MPAFLRWLNQSPAVPCGSVSEIMTGPSPAMFGGGGEVNGEGGFARAALLIGNDDGFHESEKRCLSGKTGFME